MKVDYKNVERFPQWICPHCRQHPEEKFDVLDRNTCSLEVGSPDFTKRSDFMFWELRCSHCAQISFIFELTVLSDAVGGSQFLADGCWEEEKRTKFTAQSEFLQWEHEHLEAVTFDDGSRADWVEVHRFGPFGDFNAGKMQATWAISEVYQLDGQKITK